MSDYTQVTNFTAKDALASGTAAKIIKGSDFDAEFSAISTAIATKGEPSAVETLTNKTINTASNTITIVEADISDLGSYIGASSTDTLTNKTINLGSNTVSGTTAQFNTALSDGSFVTLAGTETLTNKTLTAPAISSPTITGTPVEDVYAWTSTSGSVTDELDPDNGSIQTITLTGNITSLTDNLSAGEAITLMIDDGTSYTITWPTMTWVNNLGTAPTLATSGYTVVALWKVSTTLYGALIGDGT